MNKTNKQITITFQPDADVQRMMARALKTANGKKPRGLQTKIINDAMRFKLAADRFARKRELTEKNFAAK